MSTVPRPISAAAPEGEAAPPPPTQAGAFGGEPPPGLLDDTKNQIRELVHEIAQLVQAEIPAAEFHAGFLSRVLQALAAAGGGVWLRDSSDRLKLAYQASLEQVGFPAGGPARARHDALLARALEAGKPILVPPHSQGEADDTPGNPTGHLLLAAPLRIDQEVIGLVEVFQPPRGGPTTQRGFLRFIAQMADLAGEYYKSRRLRDFQQREQLWDRLENFLQQLYGCLRVTETAYTLANDGRPLLAADRLSVAVARRGTYQVEVVSGLDSLDRRAAQVRLLGELATAVARAGEPLWHGENAGELPPQLESLVERYVDASHARRLVVLPLRPRSAAALEETRGRRPAEERPCGVLIVESFREGEWDDTFRERVQLLAAHGGTALGNAGRHERVFLLPLWEALGRAAGWISARTLPRLAACLGLPLLAVSLLALLPADFDLPATGKLRPEITRDVFATADGVVVEAPVAHRARVRAGAVVARIDDRALELEITNLVGRIAAATEQLQAAQRALLDPQLSIEEQNRANGRLLELQESAGSLRQQLQLLQAQQRQLVITSPIDGEVVTWRVQDQLVQRPVKKGQVLLTVVQPEGKWELELHLPERRVGHLLAAEGESAEPLTVWFRLASHPGRSFHGRVLEVQRGAEVREGEGTGVLVRVAIENPEELPDLRYGTAVTARVQCGRRALGYVWFHEVWEAVQSRVLFWL